MQHKSVLSLASGLAICLMLTGCAGGGSAAPAETSAAPQPTSAAGQEAPSDVHPDIARAAELIDLPIDIEGLSAIDWEFVTLFDDNEDDSIILEVSGSNELKPALLAWLDEQDWADWRLNDSDDPDSWAIQRYLGSDYVMGMEVKEMEVIQLSVAAVPQ